MAVPPSVKPHPSAGMPAYEPVAAGNAFADAENGEGDYDNDNDSDQAAEVAEGALEAGCRGSRQHLFARNARVHDGLSSVDSTTGLDAYRGESYGVRLRTRRRSRAAAWLRGIPRRRTLGMIVVLVTIAYGLYKFWTLFNYLEPPPTVLISLDGFRAGFLNSSTVPNLFALAEGGLRAEHMLPAFPSITFPNHHTLVTGLLPAVHGIVANVFIDPVSHNLFNYKNESSTAQPEWWAGEPVWKLAARTMRRHAASHSWPGSSAVGPLTRVPFVHGTTPREILEQILKWLRQRAPPCFIAVYIADIDSAAHQFGPESIEVLAKLREIDDLIGVFVRGVRDLRNTIQPNIVIVSDHGTTSTPAASAPIWIEDIALNGTDMSAANLTVCFDGGAIMFLDTLAPTILSTAIETLQAGCVSAGNACKVYLKQNLPVEYGFYGNPRIPEIIIIAHPGRLIMKKNDSAQLPLGAHGYPVQDSKDMESIFIGNGPFFRNQRSGVKPPFQATEVYKILCKIQDLVPVPNNGTEKLDWLEDGEDDILKL